MKTHLTLLRLCTGIAVALLVIAFVAKMNHCGRSAPAPVAITSEVCETEEATIAEGQAAEGQAQDEALIADEEEIASRVESEWASHESEVLDTEDELNKVRQAARDLVKALQPDGKQDGVFLLALRPANLYIAGVDVQVDSKHKTVDVLVRRYTKKYGGSYWRAESLTGEEAKQLIRFAQD
jgi:hypothetical protein